LSHPAGNIVTVFGSSRPVAGDPAYRLAYEVGAELAGAGFTVCNGGYGGTMEGSARGARESKTSRVPPDQRTIGVIATGFGRRSANRWIDKIIKVDTMVERLLKLVSLGDAYVVLRGGTGTLLEFAAVWEFMNKTIMPEKPIVVVGPFWDSVLKTLREEAAWEGLGDCTRFVHVVHTPPECAAKVRALMGGT
jgi:uncharacterized protein (TIGR00730 family)